MSDRQRDVSLLPLERRDPPALGGIELTGRLASAASGVVYAGRAGGQPVAVVVLTEGAERDPYARARFQQAADQVGRAGSDGGLTGTSVVMADGKALRVTDLAALPAGSAVVAADSDVDIAPWVAVRADTWPEGLRAAQALLAPVALENVPDIGQPSGPMFRPYWADRRRVGRWRMWPLPWPAALTAASRWTYVAAFALVLAIATIALWIAVKIFEDQPPAPPGPGPGPIPLPTPTSPPTSDPGSPSPTPTPPPTTGPGGTGGTGGTTTAPPIV